MRIFDENIFKFNSIKITQTINKSSPKLPNYYKYFAQKVIKYRFVDRAESGFTLIESLAALAIVTVIFSVAGPMFLNQRVQNINSDIRTGAIALSQQILDSLRQEDINKIPQTGSVVLNTSLTASASSTSTTLQLASVDGFKVGQSLSVGSDSDNNNIQSINPTAKTITLLSDFPLGTSQASGVPVKLTSLGYSYDVTIQYCSNTNLPCSNSSRNVLVEVAYNAKKIYTVETVYTQLK